MTAFPIGFASIPIGIAAFEILFTSNPIHLASSKILFAATPIDLEAFEILFATIPIGITAVPIDFTAIPIGRTTIPIGYSDSFTSISAKKGHKEEFYKTPLTAGNQEPDFLTRRPPRARRGEEGIWGWRRKRTAEKGH
jgi:hypothetical protein